MGFIITPFGYTTIGGATTDGVNRVAWYGSAANKAGFGYSIAGGNDGCPSRGPFRPFLPKHPVVTGGVIPTDAVPHIGNGGYGGNMTGGNIPGGAGGMVTGKADGTPDGPTLGGGNSGGVIPSGRLGDIHPG